MQHYFYGYTCGGIAARGLIEARFVPFATINRRGFQAKVNNEESASCKDCHVFNSCHHDAPFGQSGKCYEFHSLCRGRGEEARTALSRAPELNTATIRDLQARFPDTFHVLPDREIATALDCSGQILAYRKLSPIRNGANEPLTTRGDP